MAKLKKSIPAIFFSRKRIRIRGQVAQCTREGAATLTILKCLCIMRPDPVHLISHPADMALRLARYFGSSEKFWLGLQGDYDLEEASKKLGKTLSRISAVA